MRQPFLIPRGEGQDEREPPYILSWSLQSVFLAEIHKWQVPGTICPVSPGVTDEPEPTLTGNNYADRIWLCGHASVK